MADRPELTVTDGPEGVPDAGRVLAALPVGVAVLSAGGEVVWANSALAAWCDGDPAGRPLSAALGEPQLAGGETDPAAAALAGQSAEARAYQVGPNRHLELRATPLTGGGAVVTAADATASVARQQRLDALYRAGRELAALPADQLAEMSVAERIEHLKLKLRSTIHSLFDYDVIEVRALNRATGQLEPLLDEGMTPEAAYRVLYARPQGNGVTGLVAATGRSYLCRDTAADEHYLEGAYGARSSLTVPLVVDEQVIGTLNIESPRSNAFGPEDVRVTELFAREIAQALYTLELLTAQQSSSVSQSIDAVNREVSLPVDEILSAAADLLSRADALDADAAGLLRQIFANARSVKQCIQKVGEDIAPANTPFAPAPAAGQRRLQGRRVLVVDPEERIRRSAHDILERFGCVVETARSAREALAMAALGQYDAVVCAVRLPDATGYDAFAQLRTSQPEARVILMTGFDYDASHSIVKARREGLKHVLYKPFRVDQLLDALVAPEQPAPA